ncbi:MAG TPA: LacI family DNA-binding transcriptional regulator [Chitinophagaceae bacterium]|jgi:LacI family transcriptional regulator|nr:LacI family DNA-binding transcriptional regulator [Chitinophagaceae bacterium]
MSVKIRDLAKQLNLSVATISKALKDSHEISPETKQRVFELAKKLSYIPNPYASSLRKRNSKTIAVVLPEVADSFFSLAINGIESVAHDKGYHVLIYLTHESFEREEAILKEFKSGRVDGILMSVSGETCNSNHIKEVIAAGMPLVFFDRVCDDVDTAKIVTDDFESSYKATSYLIRKGCKKIIYLSASPALSINIKRMEGYKKAIADHAIKNTEVEIISCYGDVEANYKIIKDLLTKKNKPDGIIASVEKLTTPVYIACKDLELTIPNDLKLICFTNLQTALILDPPLTTITQPAFEMGKTAATILFKGIEKKSFDLSKERVVLPSVLAERLSTGNC